jgi:pyruvate dehydrogenase E1 component
LESFDDAALQALMTGLGGHCIETLTEAFAAADDDRPTLFIAYTIKGFGLPLQGHKDNHAGLMTTTQVEALRDSLGIPAGQEWDAFAGLSAADTDMLRDFLSRTPLWNAPPRRYDAAKVPVPERAAYPAFEAKPQATQAAFGRILLELAKSHPATAERLVTTSPDVTVSTNLGAFVNQRGLFRRAAMPDVFHEAKIPSTQKWASHLAGQHVELGIAEHNLFLNLAALGLTAELWGERLLPIGTVYDPFIARGLDALNYACYQDARFMLVATPSGLTLGPEGGAHQSIHTPLIGIGQPKLIYFEPAFVDELAEAMRWSFEHMQAEDGGSVYLRLTTRVIDQPARVDDAWRDDALEGAYWLTPPAADSELALVFCGAVAPEVLEAAAELAADYGQVGVLNVVSPGRLHRGWMQARRARWTGAGADRSHAERLLDALPRHAGLVTVIDGAPAALSWLGGVKGHRVSPLGVDSFGQVGDLPDLFAAYRLDAAAIVDASAELFLS